MRKTLTASMLALAAGVALATPAFAEPIYYSGPGYAADAAAPVEFGVGAATGTVVGLGVANAWFGTSVAGGTAVGGTVVPATVASGAAVGGVVGVGTVALLDAAIQPCRGFHALLDINPQACAQQTMVVEPGAGRMRHRRVHHAG